MTTPEEHRDEQSAQAALAEQMAADEARFKEMAAKLGIQFMRYAKQMLPVIEDYYVEQDGIKKVSFAARAEFWMDKDSNLRCTMKPREVRIPTESTLEEAEFTFRFDDGQMSLAFLGTPEEMEQAQLEAAEQKANAEEEDVEETPAQAIRRRRNAKIAAKQAEEKAAPAKVRKKKPGRPKKAAQAPENGAQKAKPKRPAPPVEEEPEELAGAAEDPLDPETDYIPDDEGIDLQEQEAAGDREAYGAELDTELGEGEPLQ